MHILIWTNNQLGKRFTVTLIIMCGNQIEEEAKVVWQGNAVKVG